MVCDYCRVWNEDGERRCRRCGKRLPAESEGWTGSGTGEEASPGGPRTQGALATAPARKRRDAPREIQPLTGDRIAPQLLPRQAPLFPSGEKVIPFESFAASRVEPPPPTAVQKPGPKPPSRKTPSRSAAQQPELDFLPSPSSAPRTLGTTVEAVIFCDAKVSAVLHRAFAAAVDTGMILIAFGCFLAVFQFGGGQFTLDKQSGFIFGLAFALIAMFYGLVWVLGGRDSVGKRATALRVINFDGFPPDDLQRLMRYVGGCLSWAALGLGVLWALVDEENLTWHDHISKTFPATKESNSNFVRK